SALADERASVTTDKGVYEPDESVTFTGTNWAPGETVSITVKARGEGGEAAAVEATADEKGSFVVTATLPGAEGRDKDEEITFNVTATGSATGASARTRFKQEKRTEAEGDDDADLPGFMVGKISKEDYLSRREEHVNRLRGVERGKSFDAGARGKAIGQMERQEGNNGKGNGGKSNGTSATASATATSGAETSASGAASSAAGMAAAGVPTWTAVGPAPLPNGQTFGVSQAVSGRVTSIAVHPTNPDIAYVGTAQGGVYRTLDGGQSWTAIFDDAQSMAVGSIAIAPSQPSTIYVGTGEGNFGCDTFFGVGVYRIDNADSAAPVMSGPFSQETSTGADVLTGRSISKVLVHPTDPNTIFIATNSGGIGGVGCDAHPTQASARGVYRSTNAASANATFQKLNTTTANAGNRSATDIEFEPGNPNVLWATIVGYSTAGDGGVYRTANALAAVPTFSQVLATGTASATARTELAINKVGTTVTVYAATGEATSPLYGGQSGRLRKSTDGGVTWSSPLTAADGYCG
ncbi:MAG TPA: hypothetical protein VF654_14375, partial [Pyrinomonadaceae bacterium]